MLKIAITGPESCGKSTIAKTLAKHFQGTYYEEYARYYLEKRNGLYFEKDLEIMAKDQWEIWINSDLNTLNFYDTEMLVFKIWFEYKYHKENLVIENYLKQQKFDHYFLCAPDIPWQPDPLREHPTLREDLFEMYLTYLEKKQLPFTIIKGGYQERLKTAISTTKELIEGFKSKLP